jgi:hypothetical protein
MSTRSKRRNEHGCPSGTLPFAASGIGTARLHLPTVPEALASLLRTVVVALFLLTFVLQPYLIPSESMEHTLLVGDFLLVNKQVYAPAGKAEPVAAAVSRCGARRHHRLSPSLGRRFWSSGWWAFPATGCALRMGG